VISVQFRRAGRFNTSAICPALKEHERRETSHYSVFKDHVGRAVFPHPAFMRHHETPRDTYGKNPCPDHCRARYCHYIFHSDRSPVDSHA